MAVDAGGRGSPQQRHAALPHPSRRCDPSYPSNRRSSWLNASSSWTRMGPGPLMQRSWAPLSRWGVRCIPQPLALRRRLLQTGTRRLARSSRTLKTTLNAHPAAAGSEGEEGRERSHAGRGGRGWQVTPPPPPIPPPRPGAVLPCQAGCRRRPGHEVTRLLTPLDACCSGEVEYDEFIQIMTMTLHNMAERAAQDGTQGSPVSGTRTSHAPGEPPVAGSRAAAAPPPGMNVMQ